MFSLVFCFVVWCCPGYELGDLVLFTNGDLCCHALTEKGVARPFAHQLTANPPHPGPSIYASWWTELPVPFQALGA